MEVMEWASWPELMECDSWRDVLWRTLTVFCAEIVIDY